MAKKIKLYYTDGGVAGNGNFGNQKGFICVSTETGETLVFEEVGDKTNNEAELLAILRCIKLNHNPKKIVSDSQLCVYLIQKKWKTKIERLLSILHEIWLDSSYLDIEWRPREENKAGWIIQEKLGL